MNGSWICLAKDPKGRLLLGGQNKQPITRVTIEDGKVAKQEILNIPVSETMGMLFVGDALYISGSGSHGFALYRCKDTKGDDSYADVEFLREWQGGGGEHGSHGLVLGPDNMLYVSLAIGSTRYRNYSRGHRSSASRSDCLRRRPLIHVVVTEKLRNLLQRPISPDVLMARTQMR